METVTCSQSTKHCKGWYDIIHTCIR